MNIIEKPWGKEEILEINERYMFKKLTMIKGHRCSLQYHELKHETIYVLEGQLKIISGLSESKLSSKIYYPHEYISLKPGIVHRMEAIEDCVYLESSTPEINDVIRLNDDYERSNFK
tara:strand:+ start:295 stop:645 length:351 start_codon:yes stop_codon:yes gene_type:complete